MSIVGDVSSAGKLILDASTKISEAIEKRRDEARKIDPVNLLDASKELTLLKHACRNIRTRIEQGSQISFEDWLQWHRALRRALQYAAVVNISLLQAYEPAFVVGS